MSTQKPRFSLTLDEETFDKVDRYQHINRFPTRSLAVVDLIEKGIEGIDTQDNQITIEPIDNDPSFLRRAAKDKEFMDAAEQLYHLDSQRRRLVYYYIKLMELQREENEDVPDIPSEN